MKSRLLQWRRCLICAAAVLMLFVPFAHAATPDAILGSKRPAASVKPDETLPPIGGGGGGPFRVRCPAGNILTGVALRAGDWIDAIRPLCVTASGPYKTAKMRSEGTFQGGPSGGLHNLTCPDDLPVVIGMDVGFEGNETVTVRDIRLYCGQAVATPQRAVRPSAEFDLGFSLEQLDDGAIERRDSAEQRCSAGLLAVGINGRSGKWLDAVGLICGAPSAGMTVKTLGRVQGAATTPRGSRSICDAAEDARARNSPAATGLEAQCRAHRDALAAEVTEVSPTTTRFPPDEGGPVKVLGRANGALDTAASVCDAAQKARARNSPAARGLETRCHALGGSQEASAPVVLPSGPETVPTELPPPGRSHGVQVSGGVRYDYPHIRDQIGEFGLLDWCRDWSANCGQPAADEFCQLVDDGDRPQASQFTQFVDAGRFRETVIVSSRDACTDNSCDAFLSIVCTK